MPIGRGQRNQPAESWDCIEQELQNLSLTLQPQTPPTPTEPFGGVIHQYMDTLCTTQKQTNLTNSLLQDIGVFNVYNSTKLGDWLMDIETAADLTSKSQAKLVKAKSRGLTHTLVTEEINSDKSWEEINDLLCLKFCNANIHTYTSHFMDIQQWERNPLQHTSTGSKQRQRCNFTNYAASIRISSED